MLCEESKSQKISQRPSEAIKHTYGQIQRQTGACPFQGSPFRRQNIGPAWTRLGRDNAWYRERMTCESE